MALIFGRFFSLLAYVTILGVCFGSGYSNAPKVKLDLYYESLCPYCSNFIINGLPILFQTGLIDIVDLHLFPWGNARYLPANNSIFCQHGPSECFFNTLEACAIDAWPKLEEHFPLVVCVESVLSEGKYLQWDICFKKLGLDPKPVISCYEGDAGVKLTLKYGALTAALEPPHEYVPWVIVDGKPLLEDYSNFISYICRAYKGPLPSACKRCSKLSVLREQTKHVHGVSYTKQIAKLPSLSKIWSVLSLWV